jgi:pimeloyl-ACP methyl ester carboxylesterase
MGGRVALEALRLAPERVQRLGLLDTGFDALPAGADGELERSQRMALVEQARRDGMRAMGQTWARGMVHPDRLDTPLFEAILAMIERKTPEIFEAQQRALLARPSARAMLPTITCPTLVLCGRQDTWSPPARHVDMQQLIPQAQLTIINDCGHMSTMEQPAAVAEALRTGLRLEELPT